MTAPKVSVIIPTRNRVEMLRGAIASVLAQTERNFELIVVNDCSTDATRAYLDQLEAEDPRLRPIHRLSSGGGALARNTGIAASTGRWIAFLDDDDQWLPHKLTLQLAILEETPDAVACSTSYLRRGIFGATKLVRVPRSATFEDMLQGSIMGGASMCLCDAAVVRRIGGYDGAFRSGQDWDFWTRLSQIGKLVCCAEPTVIYCAHDGVRITNDMYAQYQGARRFHFKYRHVMTEATRTHRLAYLCFVMSRQPERTIRRRWKFLRLAILKSRPQTGLRYLASSLPRLIVSPFSFQRSTVNA